jgi:hypothetical protein
MVSAPVTPFSLFLQTMFLLFLVFLRAARHKLCGDEGIQSKMGGG